MSLQVLSLYMSGRRLVMTERNARIMLRMWYSRLLDMKKIMKISKLRGKPTLGRVYKVQEEPARRKAASAMRLKLEMLTLVQV